MADEPEKKVNGVEAAELIIKLSKPVIAHGDEIKELRFREPTGADIEACGSPIRIDALGTEIKIRYETEAMFAMMQRLAQVPTSTLRSLSARDWEECALKLSHRFFIP